MFTPSWKNPAVIPHFPHAVVLFLCFCKSLESIVLINFIYALTPIFVFTFHNQSFLWHYTLMITINLQSNFLVLHPFITSQEPSMWLTSVSVSFSSLGFLAISLSLFSPSVLVATSQLLASSSSVRLLNFESDSGFSSQSSYFSIYTLFEVSSELMQTTDFIYHLITDY